MIAFRLVFAALSLAGVVVQLTISLNSDFGAVNFFSYFTILSNIIASLVFIISAVRLARNYQTNDADVAIRGGSVVYMVFVGVVFNTLLRDVDLGGLLPWINTVHHMVMPLAVLVDWIVWPPRSRISLRTVFVWMIFPVVYVLYSLIRGAAVGFYPYPFLDPTVQRYGGVALYCAALVVAFAVLALLVRWIANRVQHAGAVTAGG
ncbi:Pr6Pr family membrane protein [Arthrobacter tecti]